jgi:hypothetical protein
VEVTASPAACSGCGRVGEVATLLAFTHAPGVVLRCPACEQVVPLVQTPAATYLGARGAAWLRLPRSTSRRPRATGDVADYSAWMGTPCRMPATCSVSWSPRPSGNS